MLSSHIEAVKVQYFKFTIELKLPLNGPDGEMGGLGRWQ